MPDYHANDLLGPRAADRRSVVRIKRGQWLLLEQPSTVTIAASEQLVQAVKAGEILSDKANAVNDEPDELVAVQKQVMAARRALTSARLQGAIDEQRERMICEAVQAVAPPGPRPDPADLEVWAPLTFVRGGRPEQADGSVLHIDRLEPVDQSIVYAHLYGWLVGTAGEVADQLAPFRRSGPARPAGSPVAPLPHGPGHDRADVVPAPARAGAGGA